jgi:predicted NBD/HSP70 family sugar kinase
MSSERARFRLAIDMGGTQTRVARFEDPESRHFTLLARIPTEVSYERQLDHLIEVIRVESAAGRLEGVGISVGAQVTRDGGSVLTAPNLRNYIGKPLVAELTARLGCPVRLAHDGVCGVLGEARFGALAGVERGAYLTISTGTGAGIRLCAGDRATTVSIQIGHQILDGNPRHCLCGQIGCLETITGGRQIALREGRSPAEITDPAFWEHVAAKLAIGLVNLAQLTRVEVVAVSGGIALAHPELRPRLQTLVDARISDASLVVLDAALGEDAPLIGAAVLLDTPPESIIH